MYLQVRGSTTDSKQTFLQKKGLTEAEITEAFKRVPEASDTTVAAPSSSTTSQLAQISRPQKPFPTAVASGPAYGQAVQPQQALQPAGYRWSQVNIAVLSGICADQVRMRATATGNTHCRSCQWQLQVALGAGLVAITFWGVQRVVFPYAAHWLRSWSGKLDKSDKQQEESQIATVNTAAGRLTSALSIMLMYDGIS